MGNRQDRGKRKQKNITDCREPLFFKQCYTFRSAISSSSWVMGYFKSARTHRVCSVIFDIYSRACEPGINLNLFIHCLPSLFFLIVSTTHFSTIHVVLLPLLLLLAFHSFIHSFIISKYLVRIWRLFLEHCM